MQKDSISVIVPLYKCAAGLPELYSRIKKIFQRYAIEHEIIFVDDRSPDDTWELLQKISKKDPLVISLQLSRNFGQHKAIAAGMKFAKKKWVIIMDGDLQDPPEFIPTLLQKAKEGYDIVYATAESKALPLVRRLSSKLFFNMVGISKSTNFTSQFGGFIIFSHKVLQTCKLFKEKDRSILFLLGYVGFNTASVQYERHSRKYDESSYSLSTLCKHALSVIFQTFNFGRYIIYFGFIIVLFSFIFIFKITYNYFLQGALPGWTTTIVLVSFLNGLTIMIVGILGLYIETIFEEIKRRPLYIIDNIMRDGKLDSSIYI